MSLSENLKRVMNERGVNAAELSKSSKVPQKTLYKLMNGEVKNPTLDTLKPLIIQLDCSADDLIFNENERDINQEIAFLLQLTISLPERKKEIIKEVLKSLISYSRMQEVERIN